ncbi:MAG TPA: outer membrane protein assembly factor BamC [Methylophilaceae bacterium]
MTRTELKPALYAGLLALTLSGCDSIPFIDNTPDYKTAGRSRPLEVPPDLTSISASDAYALPSGTATYLSYAQGQQGSILEQERILPNPDNVRMERAGSQRWLVVDAPPEKVWPVIREFWNDLGFAVRVENPETGVMETEWVDPSSITKDDKGNYLDKFQGWLDKLNALQTRQKFRTRIDRGENNTTEIYLSHRSIADAQDDGKERVRTAAGTYELGYRLQGKRTKEEEARANAEDIDAELLRRLMVRLGVTEQQSRTIVASVNTEVRATVEQGADGLLNLKVNDQFDRAWRRVGLALDRIGFVVEDRDRSRGLYFVRYADLAATDNSSRSSDKKKGLLESLKFWDSGDSKADEEDTEFTDKTDAEKEASLGDYLKFWEAPENQSQRERIYRIKVDDNEAGGSDVVVVRQNGTRDTSGTANRIITLLYEQLR